MQIANDGLGPAASSAGTGQPQTTVSAAAPVQVVLSGARSYAPPGLPSSPPPRQQLPPAVSGTPPQQPGAAPRPMAFARPQALAIPADPSQQAGPSPAAAFSTPASPAQPLLASPARRGGGGRGRPGSGAGGKKHCNCKNSRCLKLYCECFASGRYCEACNCVNCCNNHENEAVRQSAVETILERNPNAFRPKIQGVLDDAATPGARHNKGCNCKKSGCLKKYCECFQAGIFCSDNCKCIDCKNFEGSEARDLVMVREMDVTPRVPSSPLSALKRPGIAPASAHASPMGPGAAQALGGFPVASPVRLALAGNALAAVPQGLRGAGAGGRQFKEEPQGVLLREVVQEVMRRGVVEEMCQLLLLVAHDAGERVRKERAAAAAAGQLPPSSPAPAVGGASTPAADSGDLSASELYRNQERAVLREYHAILNKITTLVAKKAAEAGAAGRGGGGGGGFVGAGRGVRPALHGPTASPAARPPAAGGGSAVVTPTRPPVSGAAASPQLQQRQAAPRSLPLAAASASAPTITSGSGDLGFPAAAPHLQTLAAPSRAIIASAAAAAAAAINALQSTAPLPQPPIASAAGSLPIMPPLTLAAAIPAAAAPPVNSGAAPSGVSHMEVDPTPALQLMLEQQQQQQQQAECMAVAAPDVANSVAGLLAQSAGTANGLLAPANGAQPIEHDGALDVDGLLPSDMQIDLR